MLQFRATFLSIHFKCFEYKYDEKDAGDRDHFGNRKTIFENFKPFSKYFLSLLNKTNFVEKLCDANRPLFVKPIKKV